MDALLENGGSEQSSSRAQSVLRTAQLLYPVVLLLAFITSAGVHTIVTSRTEEQLVVPSVRGPGGKPLPVTKKKREQEASEPDDDTTGNGGLAWNVLVYLTGAVVLSFVANGAAVVAHAMQSSRNDGLDNAWWCGEQTVVRVHPRNSPNLVFPRPGEELTEFDRSTLSGRHFSTFTFSLHSLSGETARLLSTLSSGSSASWARR
jgi:hypothetical protein